jgi:hypothetical protein
LTCAGVCIHWLTSRTTGPPVDRHSFCIQSTPHRLGKAVLHPACQHVPSNTHARTTAGPPPNRTLRPAATKTPTMVAAAAAAFSNRLRASWAAPPGGSRALHPRRPAGSAAAMAGTRALGVGAMAGTGAGARAGVGSCCGGSSPTPSCQQWTRHTGGPPVLIVRGVFGAAAVRAGLARRRGRSCRARPQDDVVGCVRSASRHKWRRVCGTAAQSVVSPPLDGPACCQRRLTLQPPAPGLEGLPAPVAIVARHQPAPCVDAVLEQQKQPAQAGI